MTPSGFPRLAGVMGWPISHSLSPAMHNAAYAAVGLNWHYTLLPVAPERLPDAVRGLAPLNFAGCNVTIPHKQAILPLLQRVTPAAAAIGAVNTVVVESDGTLTGHNTDVYGFLHALDDAGLELAGQTALVLGAGGGARAVAYGLLSRGARLQLLARTQDRAIGLATDMALHIPGAQIEVLRQPPARADLIVNCTPLGMWPNTEDSPLPAGLQLDAATTVMDLVYRPLETRLLAQARAAGGRAIGGLDMLIYQGAAAFELWTGQPAPVGVMRAAGRKAGGFDAD
jgi:shikimate dehydrogenase